MNIIIIIIRGSKKGEFPRNAMHHKWSVVRGRAISVMKSHLPSSQRPFCCPRTTRCDPGSKVMRCDLESVEKKEKSASVVLVSKFVNNFHALRFEVTSNYARNWYRRNVSHVKAFIYFRTWRWHCAKMSHKRSIQTIFTTLPKSSPRSSRVPYTHWNGSMLIYQHFFSCQRNLIPAFAPPRPHMQALVGKVGMEGEISHLWKMFVILVLVARSLSLTLSLRWYFAKLPRNIFHPRGQK